MPEPRRPLPFQFGPAREFRKNVADSASDAAAAERQATEVATQQHNEALEARGKELAEKFKDTVAWLSDSLAGANRDQLWVDSEEAKKFGTTLSDGAEFLVLDNVQYPEEEGEPAEKNRFVLPIDEAHAAPLRELLGLSMADRELLLNAAYYPERNQWQAEEVAADQPERFSGLTGQLSSLLSTGQYEYSAGNRYGSDNDRRLDDGYDKDTSSTERAALINAFKNGEGRGHVKQELSVMSPAELFTAQEAA